MRAVRYQVARAGLRAWRVFREFALAVATPLVEKGPQLGVAAETVGSRVVLSMKRVVVLIFAVVVARQVAHAGVTDWPLATLAIIVIVALPLMTVLEKADPKETVRLVRALLARIGLPSKWDDHRDDDFSGAAQPVAASAR